MNILEALVRLRDDLKAWVTNNLTEQKRVVDEKFDAFMTTTTIELTAAGWSNNTQSVSVEGVTEDNNVFIAAAPETRMEFASCGIFCTAQNDGSLTFECKSVPTGAISANISIFA